VLSAATRNYDRGEKFALYKTLSTFREYVLVEQERGWVECHRRDEHGSWSAVGHDSLDQAPELTAVPVVLPRAEGYRTVFAVSASGGLQANPTPYFTA
jgi:Uma2 family endonuclease